jgi:hypothetical protein
VDFLFRIGSIYWSKERTSDRCDACGEGVKYHPGPTKPCAHLIYTHPNGKERRSLQGTLSDISGRISTWTQVPVS